MLKKILIGSLVSLGTVVAAMPAHAISFIASYNDVVSGVGGTVSGVNVGDNFSLTIELDNGGASIANQTWTSADVVNIIFDFNNGANRTVFNPVFDDIIGNFTTNGAGTLTAVPINWASVSPSVQSTNSTLTPNAWFINGFNGVYTTNNFANAVNIGNVSGNVVATNWTIDPAAAAVPFEFDPSLGVTLLGVGFFVRKTLKKKITKV